MQRRAGDVRAVHAAARGDGEIQVQIVRTIGEVRYGTSVKVDIQFWLPREAEDVSKLEFRPTDNELTVELPFEATEVDEERETGEGAS